MQQSRHSGPLQPQGSEGYTFSRRVCLDSVLAVTPFCWSLIKTRSSQDTLQLEVSGRSRPLGPGGDEPADVTVSEGGSALLDPRKA